MSQLSKKIKKLLDKPEDWYKCSYNLLKHKPSGLELYVDFIVFAVWEPYRYDFTWAESFGIYFKAARLYKRLKTKQTNSNYNQLLKLLENY